MGQNELYSYTRRVMGTGVGGRNDGGCTEQYYKLGY